MPQYKVGHIDKIKDIQTHVKKTYPNLRITGASFEAVGLPDCIRHVSQLIRFLHLYDLELLYHLVYQYRPLSILFHPE